MSKLRAHTFVFISSILWGLTFPFSKYALNFMGPEQVSFFRYFFAALIMLVYVKLSKRNMSVSKHELIMILVTGALAFVGYAYFEVKAISYISSGVVALFIGIIPVVTIAIEVLLRRRKLKVRTLLVIILAATGVYLVIRQEISLGGDIKGYLFMLLAVSSWIIYLFKAVEIKQDPFVIVMYQFGLASLIYLILFMTKIDQPMNFAPGAIAVIAYLALVSTVICYVLYFLAARKLGAGIVSIYENLVFIVGFISSAYFFKDSINGTVWISFVLILSSIGLSLTLDVQKH